jgi:hypothetical protein
MTHNTSECHKYLKDGTLKKGFSKKVAMDKCQGSVKNDHANSFMQIMEHFPKLEKMVKKAHERRNVAREIATLVILI